MGLVDRVVYNDNKKNVPVWFMRQAGRYHGHYQALRKNHNFDELCKNPELAAEVTLGPINDFDFDAAILFSDLLFPLEQMGLGLSYTSGKPTLEKKLISLNDVKSLSLISRPDEFYNFQGKAVELLRARLPDHKNLIGFVGAPFTLFCYAVLGTHSGSLVEAKTGLYDDRFQYFVELLLPNLLREMEIQANAGTDTIAIFDTAVGELSLDDFKEFIVPLIRSLTKSFKSKFKNVNIMYYSKHTTLNHLDMIQDSNIDILGVDYRHDLIEVINRFGSNYIIQGNFDPCWLHLSPSNFEIKLLGFIRKMQDSNINFDKWIMGLGHGVLPKTPEENVRRAVELIHERLRY